MKKGVLIGIIVAAVIVVVAGVGVTLALTAGKGSSPIVGGFGTKIVKACDVLTTDVATSYLGEEPAANDTPTDDTATDDINVSNCTYSSKYEVGQGLNVSQSVSLLARSAKSQLGADSNKDIFTTQLAEDAQTVNGYGDYAYWSPSFGQFNILAHNNWYILQAGGFSAEDRTLDQAKKLADLVIDKL